jgi:sensor histidine kinase YesM
MSNINERLKVLYGQDFSFQVDSRPGKGTSIRVEIPELTAALSGVPIEAAQPS